MNPELMQRIMAMMGNRAPSMGQIPGVGGAVETAPMPLRGGAGSGGIGPGGTYSDVPGRGGIGPGGAGGGGGMPFGFAGGIPPGLAALLGGGGRMPPPSMQGPMPGTKPGGFGTKTPQNSFDRLRPVMGRPAPKPVMSAGSSVGSALGR